MHWVLVLLLMVGVMTVSSPASAQATPWVVGPDEALKLLPEAQVWDVRGATRFAFSHIQGSQRVTWTEFSQPNAPRKGDLLPRAKLQQKLQQRGLRANVPVLVVGDPERGWGEEGRIVWMLRAAGHTKATMVDGGFDAFKAAGAPTSYGMSADAKPSKFSVSGPLKFWMNQSDVKRKLDGDAALLDTREKREFDGKTPYGESRGGHVPGAKHLYYKDLLTDDGRLKPNAEIEATLTRLGVGKSKEVIAYCTGGVRSGWLVVVLQHLGYNGAKNYAGSMWEWSAGASDDFPLE